jgi:hypothetical protein
MPPLFVWPTSRESVSVSASLMPSNQEIIFGRLREILRRRGGRLFVKADTADNYCLEARVGPAAIAAWGGKMKRATISVAWVQIGKAYVSYHLMGVYGNPKLLEGMSPGLKARMQGKSCFNFKTVDEKLLAELEELTVKSFTMFARAGFVDVGGAPREASASGNH